MDKPQIFIHLESSLKITPFDIKWIPSSTKFVVIGNYARNTGAILIYDVDLDKLTLLKEHEKPKALKCGTFQASSIHDRHFATGDFGGKLNIWNLDDVTLPVCSIQAHNEIINCIDGAGGSQGGKHGPPELVTGSRDGTVKVWDIRQKNEPVATMQCEDQSEKRDCWVVAFGNSYNDAERCVCAGYDNGDVKLFDLRNMALRWETNLTSGVCGLEFDRGDIEMNKLVVTCLESKFHLFDMRTKHPKEHYASLAQKAHKSTVWSARHLPQNRDVFMTTGGGGSLILWKYNYPAQRSIKDKDGVDKGVVGSVSKLQSINLSTQPVPAFDWNRDKRGLAVCASLDQAIRLLVVTKLNTL